jgi:hypothetical protein
VLPGTTISDFGGWCTPPLSRRAKLNCSRSTVRIAPGGDEEIAEVGHELTARDRGGRFRHDDGCLFVLWMGPAGGPPFTLNHGAPMILRRLLPLLLLAACTGDPSGVERADVDLSVSVDANAPAPQNNVHVQVRNESDRTLYVINACGNIATLLERREGGRWVPAPAGLVCFAAYTPPIELAPDAAVSSSIPVREAGRYRSTVRVVLDRDNQRDFTEIREEFTIGA